jgi:hypothetical protein
MRGAIADDRGSDGERLIDVENFADNVSHAERFQARGVLVEISERGFFIRKKIDPARL